MKICILGAGALGCTIGAALMHSYPDTWLINRRKTHVHAMQATGLLITDESGTRRVPVQAAESCDGLDKVDLVVLLVKSFDTETAIRKALPIIGTHTLVLSLQNGLGHETILEKIVGRRQLLLGKTYVGGVMLESGHVRSSIHGRQTIIGELDGACTERLRVLVDRFNAVGLSTSASEDINSDIWEKLLVNIATGAISSLTRLDYGRLYSVPELRDTALLAVSEAMCVARAAGAQLRTSDPLKVWCKAAENLPDNFKTSMLQSLEKGSISEVDYINGAVVDHGRRLGVSTPVNQTLLACMKGVEYRLSSGVNL